MGVGRVVYKRVVRRIAGHGPASDARAMRSLAWLVTGMLLEHDVRLERVALPMDGSRTMAARVRRLRRCLDGAVDVQAIYQQLIARAARGWRVPRAFVNLDTTSVGGRIYCGASR